MKRLAPLLLAGVIIAACGDSTDSSGQAPGGGAGSDSESVVPDSAPAAPTGSDDPVFTTDAVTTDPPATEPVTTELADTDPPPTEPPATDPPSAPSDPSPTDPPAPQPAAATDRVVRFFAGGGNPGVPWAPLGAWDGANWMDLRFSDDGVLQPLPPSPISSVAATTLDLPDGPEGVISGLTLGPEEPYCVGDEAGPVVDLPVELPQTQVSTGYNAVAVTADWPLQPRPVRQVGLEVPEYATIGVSLVSDAVATAPDGSVVQAVRVDLDGNGVEEVLVTYERQAAGDFGGEGDFSSIYVRYPSSDGTVVDELLVSYISADPTDFPTPGRYTLGAIADLNGDGVMEVMVRDSFWESAGMQVFALVDGRLSRVSGGGCGV